MSIAWGSEYVQTNPDAFVQVFVFAFVFAFVFVFVWRRRVFSNKIWMHSTLCTPISATVDKKPDLFVGDAPHQVHG